MKRIIVFVSVFVVLALLPAAYAHEELPAFTIDATAQGIDFPVELPAGQVILTFENNTEAPIGPLLARLNEDVTPDQFIETFSEGPEAAIALVSLLGGTEIQPDDSFAITFELQPGEHVFLEIDGEIPQIVPFTVTEADEEAEEAEVEAEPEEADIPVVMADYLFSMPLEIEAGVHTWSIENAGEEWHEMDIARIEPGTTIDDIMAAFMAEESGEEPQITIEETFHFAPLSGGEKAEFELELEPGTYFVVCFLPSMADGQPHVMHGMYQFLTVTEPAA